MGGEYVRHDRIVKAIQKFCRKRMDRDRMDELGGTVASLFMWGAHSI
jgi:hypothetical protein